MIDTSSINLLNIIPGNFKKVASTSGGEYHGACPFCGGKDRFVIHPHKNNPSWFCRRCEAQGDAIAFKMQYDNMTFKDAVNALQLGNQLSNEASTSRSLDLNAIPDNIAPAKDSIAALENPEWQEKAAKFVEWSWENLHSGDYPHVNQYLDERGFNHYHTDLWKLGYNPRKFKRTWGGVEVYLPEGIVIPWMDRDESIRKINVRRDEPGQSKYLQIKGGANWLFNAHKIQADSIVVLVEGELDAISISVGLHHHRIVPVATGSTTGARWLRWAALLASAHRVLIAFDDDEPGEAATQWWAKYLPNARRLLPEFKDCNEMLINRYPFGFWIEKGLGV